jgi:hypothetical protein
MGKYIAYIFLILILQDCASINSHYPFISVKRDGERKEFTFRPFFSKFEDKDKKGIDFLYPLGGYRKTKLERKVYLIPLFSSKKDLTEKNKKNFDLFPIFWGRTEKGDKYWGIFPLYGNIKDRFGKHKISFLLWPLYSKSEGEDSTTHNIIWPIFSFSKGENYNGFRIFPLYGYEKKKDRFLKKFILWPFIHIQTRDLDTDSPRKYFAILPFYVSDKSKNVKTRSILWPFFNYSEDKRNNFTLRDAPWPFYQRGKGDDIDILRIFPIYGYKYRKDLDSYYTLWPIYQYKKEHNENYEGTTRSFLIIDRYKIERWKKDNKETKSIWIWPLFSYKRDKENNIKVHFPELLPLDDEGLERNYGPLLRIYDYNKNWKGDIELRILWGLYSDIKKGPQRNISLSFLVNYEKNKEGGKFSILKGLFEVGKNKNNKYLKLLYLKIP